MEITWKNIKKKYEITKCDELIQKLVCEKITVPDKNQKYDYNLLNSNNNKPFYRRLTIAAIDKVTKNENSHKIWP